MIKNPLNYTQAMPVQVCFFSAYFFMSIPSGRLTLKKGYRFGIVAGLGIAGVGTFGFLPVAQMGSYTLFLIFLFILASGITLLQVVVNPYVTLLGSILILESENKVTGVQIPYLTLTIALVVVTVVFSKIPLP